MRMEDKNMIITNDSISHTFINLIVDNSKTNHKELIKFLDELHELGKKYSLVNIKGGVLND